MKKRIILFACLLVFLNMSIYSQFDLPLAHTKNKLTITYKTGKTFPIFKNRLETEMKENGFDATLTQSFLGFSSTKHYPILHKSNYLVGLDIAYSFMPNLSAGLYFEKGPDFWFEGIYDKPDLGAFLDIHYMDYKIGTLIRFHAPYYNLDAGPVFAISNTFAEVPVYLPDPDPTPLPFPVFIIPDPDHHERIDQKTVLRPGFAASFEVIVPERSRKWNFFIGGRTYCFFGTPAFGPYEVPAFTFYNNTREIIMADPIIFPKINTVMIQTTFHLGFKVNIALQAKEEL